MFFVPSWHTLMKQLVVPLDVPQWNSSKHQWPYMFPFLPWHPLVKPSIVPPDVLWWNNWQCQWPYMFPTKRISSLCSREIFSLRIFLLGGVWIQMIHVGLQNLVAGHITCHISSRTCYIVWICNMLDSWVNILYSTFITWRITGDNSIVLSLSLKSILLALSAWLARCPCQLTFASETVADDESTHSNSPAAQRNETCDLAP